MAVKKLHSIKFANSIRFGSGEQMFVSTADEGAGGKASELELVDGMFVRMVEKRSGLITNSSILNAVWWKFEEDSASEKEYKARPKGTVVKKKGAQAAK